MQDLLASFLPRFRDIASKRVTNSIELATQRSPEGVTGIARELHSIAGEAGLLGLTAIVSLARAGEEHVKRLRASRSDDDADALLGCLTQLREAIEVLSQGAPTNT
jgi:HPt (histidine-containing phosphotransfer) domain-containing protein